MKDHKVPFLKSIFFITVLFFISSCVPLLIGGGGVAAITGGRIIAQEKTVGQSISDTTIWTKIKTKLSNRGIDRIMMGSINLEVNEGRVLLTGIVTDKNKIITILKVCWSVTGVKEVINELQIAEEKDKPGVFTQASDAWITTKIKGKFLASKQISSVNYTVETIEGIVYLFGTSQSQTELDDAIDLVSATTGVKKIVSYVRVKKDIEKKLSETKGKKTAVSKKKEKKLMDYDFDYSDIHPLEEEGLEKPTIIKPKRIDHTSEKDKNDVFEDDDF
jgi:osmotically-inducible protein OsmY